MSDAPDSLTVVSHEQDGRVLSGVGVTVDELADTMAREAPAETPPESAPAPATQPTTAAASSGEPKPTRGQARFSELTKQAKDAQARAEAAERERDELKARLSSSNGSTQAPSYTPPAPSSDPTADRTPPPPQYTRPKPSEDEVGTAKYPVYGDFTEDLALWVWEQQQGDIQARIRQGIEADRAQQTFTTHVESTRARGRTIYQDFDAVLSGPASAATAQMPPTAQQFIWQQPNAEHLVYAILKDPALAQKLTWLSIHQPAAFGLELARLAPAAPAASSASTGTPGSGTPPPPMQPVGSGSKTTVLPSTELAERGTSDYDRSGYREKRAAELGRTRR